MQQIDKPSHYVWLKETCGVEPQEIAAEMDYHSGTAFVYLIRSQLGHCKVGHGEDELTAAIRDTEKAIKHLEFRRAWLRLQDERRQLSRHRDAATPAYLVSPGRGTRDR